MRRRITALALALCMALSLLPAGALAAGEEFEIVGGTLVRYNGPGGDVTIPDGVTEIGYEAFGWCDNLMSVTIPNSVTVIGNSAFAYCHNLRNVQLPSMLQRIEARAFQNTGIFSISIPDGVTEIGWGTFESCNSLNSVELGGVRQIGSDAFRNCWNLRSVESGARPGSWDGLPDEWNYDPDGVAYLSNVERIDAGAFSGCSSLRRVWLGDQVRDIASGAFSDDYRGGMGSALEAFAVSSYNYDYTAQDGVLYNHGKTTLISYPPKKEGTQYTIPNTVETIAAEAFQGASALTSVTIPCSVTTIGDAAFKDSGLTGVTIPTGVTQIGSSTFEGCGSLANVTIPNTVTEIGDSAFEDCVALSAVTIPDSVKNIGYEAFIGCGALTTLIIPDHVERIGGNAFYNCDKLETVTIGSGVKDIGTRAFNGCNKLTAFTVSEANTAYQDIEGVLYNKRTVDGTQTTDTLIQYPASRAGTEYTVVDSVKTINDNAFEGAAKLTKVTMPEGLETIAYSAFEGCTALASITVPDSVKTIEGSAFWGCEALTEVTLGSGLETIESYAFWESGLTGVTIPAGVKKIESSAFKDCAGLSEVKILAAEAEIGSTAFDGCAEALKFQVYADSTAEDFCIKKKFSHSIMARVTMTEGMVSFPAGLQAVYNQAAHTPEVIVKDGEKTLTKDTNYTVAYENNTDAGQEAKVTVTGKRNYSGSVTKTFAIAPAAVTEAMFTVNLDPEAYTGAAITKTVAGKDGEKAMVENTDYTVAYADNTNAGEAKLTVTGKGNYQGTVAKSFTITAKALTAAMFTVGTPSVEYTGAAIAGAVTGIDGSKALVLGTDYTVACTNNVNAGTATITATGKGNYSGTVDKTFTITPVTVTQAMFTVDLDSEVYTGADIEKTVTGVYNGTTMVMGTDYTVEHRNNTAVGTATVAVTGKGNYTGSVEWTFSIISAGVDALVVTLAPGDTEYTGAAITQTVTVKQGAVTLTEGTHYTVSYADNVNVGTATVTVTGMGNYSGTATKSFNITPKPLTDGMFTVNTPSAEYTGTAITGTVTGSDGSKALVLDTDYTVACTDNVNAGTATITVTGKGNYSGTVTKNFTITPKLLTDGMFTVDTPSTVYTGAAIAGAVTGTDGSTSLVPDTDYTVSCTDNINVGTATITVTGKGNYGGTVTKAFAITQAAITNDMFIVDTDPAAYTGMPIEKSVSGSYNGKTMTPETDYTVEYQDNTNVGTATLTIKGKGNFSGELSKQFSIMAEALTESMFTVDTDPEVYTGSAITKMVTGSAHGSSLTEGTDYRVRYENNIDAGTAKLIISGAGDYGGTVTKTFTITPVALSNVALEIDDTGETYTGESITKEVTGSYKGMPLTKDADYTVSGTDNVNVGTATITVTGKGNYQGTVTKSFTITPAAITDDMFPVNMGNEVHTGAAIKKPVTGTYNGKTMSEGTDYTVEYQNNVDVGTATLTIKGTGNFSGELSKSFRITVGALKEDMFTVDLSDGVYTGSAITRTVTGKDGEKTLAEGTDYSVAYADNINAGTAKLVISGAGDYGGTVTKTFTILPAPLTELTPTLTGTAKEGGTLSAKLEGVDDKELTWTWTVGGTAVAGQTGSSYTVKSGDGGKTVAVKATAVENGNYTGSTKDSAVLTIEEKKGGSGSGYWGSLGSSSGESAKGKEIQVTMGETTSAVGAMVTAGKKGEAPVVSIKGSGVDALVKEIRRSDAERAGLDFSVLEEERFTAELPKGVIEAFAEREFQTVTLRFPAGEVDLSRDVLRQLSQQGKEKVRLQLAADDERGLALTATLDGRNVEEAVGGWKLKGKVSVDGEPKGVVAFLVDDEGGERLLRTSHYEDGQIIAKVPGASNIVVRNAAGVFDDVPAGYWGAGDVAYVSARGLMSGLGKGRFGPETAVSRAMVVTILYRMAEEPAADAAHFSDVVDDKYYSNAVAWAAEQGIVKGYKDATFRPNGDMTREELAVTLYRYAQAAGMDVTPRADLSAYSDAASVSKWAREAVEWMVGTGLLQGVKKDQLAPTDSVTRAQMAAIMARYFARLED